MRILLVNFALIANYGGILQCYALQEVLKGMGHRVVKADLRKQCERGLQGGRHISLLLFIFFAFVFVNSAVAFGYCYTGRMVPVPLYAYNSPFVILAAVSIRILVWEKVTMRLIKQEL